MTTKEKGKVIELPRRRQISLTFEWLAWQLGILGKDDTHIVAIEVDHISNMLRLIVESNLPNDVPEGEEAPEMNYAFDGELV